MQSLRLLVAIYETGSVTGASEVLHINQSSASQGLDKLRRILGDPLFTKVGRGITPTDHVELIIPKARQLLAGMTDLLEPDEFDPNDDPRPFVIATNSHLRKSLVRELFTKTNTSPPTLKIIGVGHGRNIEDILIHDKADIVIANGQSKYSDDIMSHKIFDDHMVCYYDASVRSAPDTLELYCNALHAVIDFGSTDDSVVDICLKHYRKTRRIGLYVPVIEALPRLMKGTPLIATMHKRLSASLFSELQYCEAPISIPDFTIEMIWHARSDNSPRNRWMRSLIQSVAKSANS